MDLSFMFCCVCLFGHVLVVFLSFVHPARWLDLEPTWKVQNRHFDESCWCHCLCFVFLCVSFYCRSFLHLNVSDWEQFLKHAFAFPKPT